MPKVSILIPTYNRWPLLEEAIGSVLAQSEADWELIIVDDGSTDETVARLKEIDDNRITLLEHPHCGNPGQLRNFGARHARANYLAFLDSDDLFEPDKLERQLGALENAAWSWTESSRRLGDAKRRGEFGEGANGADLAIGLMRHERAISTPTVMISRKVFEVVGGFDEVLFNCEDFDLWIRLALHADAVFIPELLTTSRAMDDRFPSPEGRVTESWARVFSKHTSHPTTKVATVARSLAAQYLRRMAKQAARSGTPGIALNRFRESFAYERFSGAVLRDGMAIVAHWLRRNS